MFVHIFVSLLLIIVVLLQSGKSADLAGAFGGAGSQSTFGPRGAASLLSKITTTLAILFMVTSLLLWILASKKSKGSSVVTKGSESVIEQTAPAQENTPAPEEKPAVAPVTEEQPKEEAAEPPAEQAAVSEEKTENKEEQK
jgi:preprotein translocase subunit SecG